ncbi:hypothetical protein ACF0H5_004465 [Mactra antiquata]
MDKHISLIETNMNNSLSAIMQSLDLLKETVQKTGSSAGRHRPLISLNNGIDPDIVSLYPNENEVRHLCGSGTVLSENSDRSVSDSTSSISDNRKNYEHFKQPELGEIFGFTSNLDEPQKMV